MTVVIARVLSVLSTRVSSCLFCLNFALTSSWELISNRSIQASSSIMVAPNHPCLSMGFSTLKVDPPELFVNPTRIATKLLVSFVDTVKKISSGEVKRLLREGIREPSRSPWRAQVVVITDENHKKRLQSRTKLLEKVFPIMSTFLRNKTISKTTPLREENPFPRFNVASQKRPGIRLSFEYTTTLLSGEGGEGRTSTATIFRKMLPKYTIFSTVLSKIVAIDYSQTIRQALYNLN